MKLIILVISSVILVTACQKNGSDSKCNGIDCYKSKHQTCGYTSPDWHLEAHGEPAVRQILADKGISPKIAILDRDFGTSSNGSLLLPVEYNQDYQKSIYETHGDQVSYFINGQFGYSRRAEVALVPYAAMDFHPDKNRYEIGIIEACSAGYTTINFSGSDNGFFRQKYQLAQFGPKFLNELKNKGCILVQSSGNSGYGAKIQTDDALISVGALDSQGDIANFSTIGEIYAQGHQLYNAPSQQQANCGSTFSGTSFSSAIVASEVANIRSVLELNVKFAELESNDKVDEILKIVNTSKIESNQEINYPLAVQKALAWPNPVIQDVQSKVVDWDNCYRNSVDECLVQKIDETWRGSLEVAIESTKELADHYKKLQLVAPALYYIRKHYDLKNIPFRNEESVKWANNLVFDVNGNSIPVSDIEANIAFLTLVPNHPLSEGILRNSLVVPENPTLATVIRPTTLNRSNRTERIVDLMFAYLDSNGLDGLLDIIKIFENFALSELEAVQPSFNFKLPQRAQITRHQDGIYFYLFIIEAMLNDTRFGEVQSQLSIIQQKQLSLINKNWLIPLKPIAKIKELLITNYESEPIKELKEISFPEGFDTELFSFLYEKNKQEVDTLIQEENFDRISGIPLEKSPLS